MAVISFIGMNPDKEAIHRCLVHRDIGDPGDKLFVHFGIANRDILTRSGPSISGTHIRRFRGVEDRSIGDFEGKKPLQLGTAKRDISMIEGGAIGEPSKEDRWQVKGRKLSEDQRLVSRQIGIFVDKGSGKSIAETLTQNLSRPFGGTRVRHPKEVGDRHIVGSEGVCTLTARTPKP
jgi:hypothetical protein